jgi:hypothetical protein
MDTYEESYKRKQILDSEVYPYLNQYLEPILSINFMNYLAAVQKCKLEHVADHFYLADAFFMLKFDFLKQYKDKCVGFSTMGPDKWSSHGFIRAFYQISPTLHFGVGIGVYFDKETVLRILHSGFVGTKDYNEYLQWAKDIDGLIVKEGSEIKHEEKPFGGLLFRNQ